MSQEADEVVVAEGSGEWSALYVNDALVTVGDAYLIDEKLREIFGVETLYTDEFLQSGDTREHCLPTLTAVRAAVSARRSRVLEAEEIRAEAAKLLADADRIERGE